MSISIPGKLPDALINSGHVVRLKQEESAPAVRGERMQPLSEKKLADVTASAQKLFDEGKVKDLTPMFDTQTDRVEIEHPEGKTVIDNAGKPIGLIVGSTLTPEGKIILTPDYGASRAQAGAPDHAFFYHDTDFLTEAAKKYATLGENEVFRYRDIQDQIFVQDTLDFFTGGNYNAKDIAAMQEQITDVVKELAQQIKSGESVDLSRLQTKVTIGGADVAFSQLLDFQRVGGELKEAFDELSVGQVQAQTSGKMGLAKAMSDYYANDKGAVGDLFSAAMGRLYEKGVAQLEKTAAYMDSSGGAYIGRLTERGRDAIKTSNDVRDLFAKLDTSSRESMKTDFNSKLSQMRTMVQAHCSQYGIPTTHVGLAGDTAGLTQLFADWMNRL